MGPSKWLHLPQKFYLILLSFTLIGFFEVFVFLTVFPEMLERLQISLNISTKDKYLYSRLNDKCNDAFGFIFAFTNSFAPILGSVIEENVGPQVTCDIHWCFFVFYGVIIFTFNCGPNFRKENQEF